MKALILVLFFVIAYCTNASETVMIGEDEVRSSLFDLDLQKSPSDYAGTYHFGFSEGESTFEIKVSKNKISAKLSYGLWNEKKEDWEQKTIVLKNVKIIGNIFIADKWYGVFMTYKTGGLSRIKGLLIYKSSWYIKNEFGERTS